MKTIIAISFLAALISCTDGTSKTDLTQLKNKQKMEKEVSKTNKEKVKSFFMALEKEDAQLVANHFSTDARHINPYHSGIFPKGANGKEEIKGYWQPVFPNFDGMTFTIEEIYAMENPQIVFVKYTGNIKLKNNAGVYSNNYYSTFKFNDEHEITEYVEIFNPITAAKAFNITID